MTEEYKRNLELLSAIKKNIEDAMTNEIDTYTNIPEKVINLLAELHSELKIFLDLGW